MIKNFPILQGRAYVVELPDGATDPEVHTRSLTFDTPMEVDEWGYDYQSIKLPEGAWEIMGLLPKVMESEAAELVDKHWQGKLYADYREWSASEKMYGYRTALESLESAILAEGYFLDINPKPKCGCKLFTQKFEECPNINKWLTSCSVFDEHEAAQSRVLSRERCLLLRRVE